MDSQSEDDEDWGYYIVHDGLGISHVLRRPKDRLPQVRCLGCDD